MGAGSGKKANKKKCMEQLKTSRLAFNLVVNVIRQGTHSHGQGNPRHHFEIVHYIGMLRREFSNEAIRLIQALKVGKNTF